MRPSEAIMRHRSALLEITGRHGLANVRVFGSAARGQDCEGSDIDLLVDVGTNTTLLALVRAKREAEELTGINVDIHTLGSIHQRYHANVLQDARPL